jgi:uncharacterized protein YndB with AHSA1/START domain
MIRSVHTIYIGRPVSDVFSYLADHENRTAWQTNLVSHEGEHLAKGTRATEVRNVLGKRIEIAGEITEFEPGSRLSFSGSGPHVTRLEYHYRLRPENGGTRLDTEVDLELADHLGLAIPVIQRLTDREVDNAQQTLKDLLEQHQVREIAKTLPKHTHHR